MLSVDLKAGDASSLNPGATRKKKAVVITGAGGFIGYHLASYYAKTGRRVIKIDRSFGDATTNEPFDRVPIKSVASVIHLAGRNFVPDAWHDPANFLINNVLTTIRALEFCRRASCKMVFMSTYVYGSPTKLPINELDPIKPSNPYALSKVMGEDMCDFYSTHYKVPITILRPFNIYGPRQDAKFLIPSVIKQIRQKERINIQSLIPRRDMVYVLDVVKAIARAEERQANGCHIFNVGSGVSHSVAEIIEVIQTVAKTRLEIVNPEISRPGEIWETRADITKAKTVLGWLPEFDLYRGLSESWAFYTRQT